MRRDSTTYKAATQALVASPVAGFVMSMDLVAYRSVIPAQLPDSGYYACLTKLIAAMSREWHRWNERVAANSNSDEPIVNREAQHHPCGAPHVRKPLDSQAESLAYVPTRWATRASKSPSIYAGI
jgi:hypothetical protein